MHQTAVVVAAHCVSVPSSLAELPQGAWGRLLVVSVGRLGVGATAGCAFA